MSSDLAKFTAAVTVLNVVISTIPNVFSFATLLPQAKARFNSREEEFAGFRDKTACWDRKWKQGDTVENPMAPEILWGREKAQHIENQRRNIATLADAHQRYLNFVRQAMSFFPWKSLVAIMANDSLKSRYEELQNLHENLGQEC